MKPLTINSNTHGFILLTILGFLFNFSLPTSLNSQPAPAFAVSEILPDYLKPKVKVEGTGRTTGHVITCTIENPADEDLLLFLGPYVVPPTGKYQGYVIPEEVPVTIPANNSAIVPLDGFCTDIHLPAVPAGHSVVDFDDWVTPETAGPVPDPSIVLEETDGFVLIESATDQEVILTYPGTDEIFPYNIDIKKHPVSAAPFLFAAIDGITDTYDEMNGNGEISTPFSPQPAKQRESVIQQTFWIYTSALTGDAYKMDDFEEKMIEQYEATTKTDYDDAPEETQSELQEGVADFWFTFEAVGNGAKLFSEQAAEGPDTAAEPPKCLCDTLTLSIEVFVADYENIKFSPLDSVIKQKTYIYPGNSNKVKDEVTYQSYKVQPGDLIFISVDDVTLKCKCNNEKESCTEIFGKRKDHDPVRNAEGDFYIPGADYENPGEFVASTPSSQGKRRGVKPKPAGIFTDNEWKEEKKYLEKINEWITGKYDSGRFDLEFMEVKEIKEGQEYFLTVKVKAYCRDKKDECGGELGGMSCMGEFKIKFNKK